MRDGADNVVVVCSIENVDPVGVHTGDSITVAPSLTLTDREYQTMRDVAIAVIREVEIGRASCRERVKISAVDVWVQGKEKITGGERVVGGCAGGARAYRNAQWQYSARRG